MPAFSVGKSLHLISDCLPPFIISLQLGTSQSLPLVKDMRHSLCLISGSHCVQFVHLPTDLAHQVSVFPICMSLASTALSRAARNQTIGVFCLIRAQLSNFPAPALWWAQMWLSNFLLTLCYHFHHSHVTASAAGLPFPACRVCFCFWLQSWTSQLSVARPEPSVACRVGCPWWQGETWDTKSWQKCPGVDSLLSSQWHKLFLSVSISAFWVRFTGKIMSFSCSSWTLWPSVIPYSKMQLEVALNSQYH